MNIKRTINKLQSALMISQLQSRKGKGKMRLIDADEFKKQIAGMAIVNNYSAAKANKMCELIDGQPTAYDVDKVAEQIKKIMEDESIRFADRAVNRSVNIVKSGVIE